MIKGDKYIYIKYFEIYNTNISDIIEFIKENNLNINFILNLNQNIKYFFLQRKSVNIL